MIFVLVLWRIKKECREQFISDWKKKFVVTNRDGLAGEFLSEPIDTADPKLKTFDLLSVGKVSDEKAILVNVGIWRSEADFDEQVAKYMKSTDADKREYEFEVRQRVLLAPVAWRIGNAPLPEFDSEETN